MRWREEPPPAGDVIAAAGLVMELAAARVRGHIVFSSRHRVGLLGIDPYPDSRLRFRYMHVTMLPLPLIFHVGTLRIRGMVAVSH